MQSFKQWFTEQDNLPQSYQQKTVAANVNSAIGKDPKAIQTLKNGNPVQANKLIGKLTTSAMKIQQNKNPNMIGKPDATVGDMVSTIDNQIGKISKDTKIESTLGKSGSGTNKGFGPKDNTFGDRRGGARKTKNQVAADLRAGVKVPKLGLMLNSEPRKKPKPMLGKIGDPKIIYSKLPSEG